MRHRGLRVQAAIAGVLSSGLIITQPFRVAWWKVGEGTRTAISPRRIVDSLKEAYISVDAVHAA